MTRSRVAAMLLGAMVVGIPGSAQAQDTGALAGRWTLNRGLSQFPLEIGFDADWLPAGGGGDTDRSGGRGGRGSGGGGAGAFAPRRESEDDAKRVQQLTAEVRAPSAHLTIVETSDAITISDDRKQSRTFHPSGREELFQLESVPVQASARREAGRLVVLYKVELGRELRYTYSRIASPAQLVVDVQFLERGKGDTVRLVYEPTSAAETPEPAPPAPQAVPPQTRTGNVPVSGDRPPAQAFNQKPGAELKGLTKLGVEVEGLSPQAAACGLKQDALQAAVSKQLSDAGFSVARTSDQDTYVYVNVITTSLSTGLCISRYDVSLYTYTTAALSYQKTAVLVQVSLLHKGGLTGGAPAAHADGVLKGVQGFVDQFLTQIRDANK